MDHTIVNDSRSKSLKRKNKSFDTIKLKNNNASQIGIRSKYGVSFDVGKKYNTGDLFAQMHSTMKK